MPVPVPTPIYRLTHLDNLPVCLQRGGLHAPNHTPRDGLVYKTIHNPDIQRERRTKKVPCGPGGVIHDYVSFYFGPRSPLLYQLHTGWVAGYDEGQEPLIYLVSTAQAICGAARGFAFSDGHGIAAFTKWYDDLTDLDKVDWDIVGQRYWRDDVDDMDRQRRKQAEFLVHQFCDWSLIEKIGVVNDEVKAKVEAMLRRFPNRTCRPVWTRTDWYY